MCQNLPGSIAQLDIYNGVKAAVQVLAMVVVVAMNVPVDMLVLFLACTIVILLWVLRHRRSVVEELKLLLQLHPPFALL